MTLEFRPEIAASIFLADLLSDAVYTYYIAKVAKNEALQATAASAFLYAAGVWTLYNGVENPIYFVPGGIGAAIGTYTSMRLEKWREKRDNTKVNPIIQSVMDKGDT